MNSIILHVAMTTQYHQWSMMDAAPGVAPLGSAVFVSCHVVDVISNEWFVSLVIQRIFTTQWLSHSQIY